MSRTIQVAMALYLVVLGVACWQLGACQRTGQEDTNFASLGTTAKLYEVGKVHLV